MPPGTGRANPVTGRPAPVRLSRSAPYTSLFLPIGLHANTNFGSECFLVSPLYVLGQKATTQSSVASDTGAFYPRLPR